jgi:hypothetical protein
VLLVFGAPGRYRLLAGQERGRTIPLGDMCRDKMLVAYIHLTSEFQHR